MGFSWMQGEGWGPKQQGNSIQQRLCQLLLRHGPAPSPRGISGGAALFGCGCMGWPSTHKLCLSTQFHQQQRAQGPLSAQLRLLLTPGSAPSCQEVSLRITSLALRHRTAQRGQEEGTSEACAAKEFLLCCGWCIPAQSSSRIACPALR